MKIKKYFLLILSLIFINFLNLNAATTKGNIRKLSSQKAIAEINLTYKYVENGEYTEIYDENGKLLFRDKSYIPEPNITTSAIKVKIILKNGKKIPITEQYFPSDKIRAITEYNLKVKDEDIEKNDIRKFYTSNKLGQNIYNSVITETYYESGNLKTRMTDTGDKGKLEGYYENGNLITEANLINEKMGELTKTYPEGIVKNYYPNGILKSKIKFKKGLGNGIYETYYENGKPDGKYEVYGPDGKLEESVFYKNGEVVK
ncbi:phosphatidylinositol-4-phosphate 5-kinase [Fusobacterium polymorphum]|uniref:toxin-antitoxin system YwqK family antitoxin n=1 Tax=Fusobacterium nucleatum subsp. polymorphum TaxID=76857 RepID=UPI00300828D2